MKKETSILNTLLNYKNWTLKLNWSGWIVLLGMTVGFVYFWNDNKKLRTEVNKIPILEKTISNQGTSISALQSSNSTFNNVIQSFMLNPPSSLQKDINRIEKIIDFYHPNNSLINADQRDTSEFIGNSPPSF